MVLAAAACGIAEPLVADPAQTADDPPEAPSPETPAADQSRGRTTALRPRMANERVLAAGAEAGPGDAGTPDAVADAAPDAVADAAPDAVADAAPDAVADAEAGAIDAGPSTTKIYTCYWQQLDAYSNAIFEDGRREARRANGELIASFMMPPAELAALKADIAEVRASTAGYASTNGPATGVAGRTLSDLRLPATATEPAVTVWYYRDDTYVNVHQVTEHLDPAAKRIRTTWKCGNNF